MIRVFKAQLATLLLMIGVVFAPSQSVWAEAPSKEEFVLDANKVAVDRIKVLECQGLKDVSKYLVEIMSKVKAGGAWELRARMVQYCEVASAVSGRCVSSYLQPGGEFDVICGAGSRILDVPTPN